MSELTCVLVKDDQFVQPGTVVSLFREFQEGKAELLWSQPKGQHSKLSFWAVEPNKQPMEAWVTSPRPCEAGTDRDWNTKWESLSLPRCFSFLFLLLVWKFVGPCVTNHPFSWDLCDSSKPRVTQPVNAGTFLADVKKQALSIKNQCSHKTKPEQQRILMDWRKKKSRRQGCPSD